MFSKSSCGNLIFSMGIMGKTVTENVISYDHVSIKYPICEVTLRFLQLFGFKPDKSDKNMFLQEIFNPKKIKINAQIK